MEGKRGRNGISGRGGKREVEEEEGWEEERIERFHFLPLLASDLD